MKTAKKLLKFSLATTAIGLGSVAFLAPKEMQMTPSQLATAYMRGFRISYCGVRMFVIYKFSDLPMDQKHTKAALILKEGLIRNAGVYIKLGQQLATLEILLPDEYIRVMQSMYQHAPTSSYEEVIDTIEADLKCPMAEIFSEFDPKPISSASIAQVHKAVLKKTGETVAVKVQHQWLRESLPIDIKITEIYVLCGEKLFPDQFNFSWILYDLKKDLPKE